MGRIFETRKATMFKRWDRMAKAFTRVGREIAIAVRAGGPNPDNNPALRRAIQNARAANMPKDKVQKAIAKASGQGAADYKLVIYEGYAPHGVAVLIETATDNTTRTVASMRLHFNKCDGNLGNSGSVAFQFTKMGIFRVKPEGHDRDELELELIDHGLEDMEDVKSEDGEALWALRCAFEDFGTLQAGLDGMGIEPVSSGTDYVAQSFIELDDAQTDDVLKLVDRLEQDDDVQSVFHNLA